MQIYIHAYIFISVYIYYIHIHTYMHTFLCNLFSCPHMTAWKETTQNPKTNFFFIFIFFCYSILFFPSSPSFFFFLFFFFFSKRGNNCIIFFLSLKNIRKQEDSGLGFICPFFVCLFVLVLNGHGILMAEKYTSECFCKAQFCLFFFF